jgi:hypothetical protein
MTSLLDRFHQHLDRCAQCRNNPHNLCAVGALILTASALAGMIAAEHRLQSDICPVCGGDGVQVSGVRGARPCVACDGTGQCR